MFGLGVAGLIIGYAFMYTGVFNLRNGGQGPTLWQSLGITTAIDGPTAPTGSDNGTGQPPSFPSLPFFGTTPI